MVQRGQPWQQNIIVNCKEQLTLAIGNKEDGQNRIYIGLAKTVYMHRI